MRIGVLASGGGTILDAIAARDLPIVVVVTDRPCGASEVAERHGIPAMTVERASYGGDFDRDAYTDRVLDALGDHGVDLVAMAGFGTILGPSAFDRLPGRILNTHPALLPAFPGWHAVDEAIAAGVKVTGCTVHLATAVVDDGPILAQETVEVRPDDTVDTLHERIKTVERRLYPDTIEAVVRGELPLPPGGAS